MSCTYEFNVDENVIEMICKCRITRDCVLKDLDALEASPRKIAELDEFRDYSAITELALDCAMLENLAQLMRGAYLRAGWRKRIAMWAPNGPGRTYALAMHEALDSLTSLETEVFDTREAARAFLNGGDRRSAARRLG